jgi:iron complex transport system ATP-binding protein
MLELKQVSYHRQEHILLQALSLVIEKGKMIALLGTNGAGKTTLLRLCAGLIKPTTGEIYVQQQLLAQFELKQRAKLITYLPHNHPISFRFSVEDVIMMGRHPHLSRFQMPTAHDRAHIDNALQWTDCEHLRFRFIDQLSSGERQRVLIARALATGAEYLLLDEPTANLDIAHTLAIFKLAQELVQQGKTIIFSTHDINIAACYADNVILLAEQRCVRYGTVEQVLTPEMMQQIFAVNATPIFTDHKNKKTVQFSFSIAP